MIPALTTSCSGSLARQKYSTTRMSTACSNNSPCCARPPCHHRSGFGCSTSSSPRIESLIEHQHTSLRDSSPSPSPGGYGNALALLDLLEILAQDYLNTLALLFDPLNQPPANMAQTTLRRAILLLIWQIQLHDRISATPRAGLWQQLHSTYQSARRLAVERHPGPQNGPSIERIYSTPCCLQPFSRLPTRQRNSASSTIWSGAFTAATPR